MTAAPAHAEAAVSTYTYPPIKLTTTTNSFSFPHTVSGGTVAGSDRYLVLAVSSQSVANNDASYAVLTATWTTSAGSEPFKSRVVRPLTAQAHRTRSEIWTLQNPSPGSGTISVTLQSNADIVAGAATLVNIDPNATQITGGTDLSPGGTTSLSIQSYPGGIVFDNIADDRERSLEPTSPQQKLWRESHPQPPLSGTITGGASFKKAVTTSTTMSWTGLQNGDKGGLVAVSFGGVSGATAVKLDSFTAAQFSGGTSLKWRTGWEADNLGFNVYRQVGSDRIKLNDDLIAGGALLTRSVLTAGNSYSWVDGSTTAEAYWLEDVDVDGTRSWHGPFKPFVRSVPLPPAQSPTLSDLADGGGKSRSGRAKRMRHSAPGAQARIVQSRLAGMPAVKISVSEEGWYRVPAETLAAAGLKLNQPSRLLRLFVQGSEVPIAVADGEDGRFGAGDSIHFFGTGVDTAYTDRQVYWLTSGLGAGLRMPVISNAGAFATSASFPDTAELRERSTYAAGLLNGEGGNYFGRFIRASGLDQTLNLPGVAPVQPSPVQLEVTLQGATTIDTQNPDHQVLVKLNGVAVGQVTFDGRTLASSQFKVNPGLIREGENTVSLIPQAGPMDVSLVESIRLTYARTYAAEQGALRFTASGGLKVSVSGFDSSDVLVVDITNPEMPRLVASTVKPSGNGFVVTAGIPSGGPRELLAVSEPALELPAGVAPNQPSSLARLVGKADLLMIAPRNFIGGLAPLKELREAQGLRVGLIDVEDIYDEFAFGEKTPHAIRTFLALANAKSRGARFVLLAGDASVDPRGFLGTDKQDLVPTKMIDTENLEAVSDDWLVDFNMDALPDMAIGRLPAQTVEQLQVMVSKIVAYEQNGPVGGALMVADQNNGFDFEGAASAAAGLVPGGADKIFRGQTPNAKSALLGALNAGYSLVNYSGHGSGQIWPGMLTMEEAGKLTNGNRLSFVVAMNCLSGYFCGAYVDTIAENLLLAPEGGAVAVWASTAQCRPGGQVVINQALLQNLFNASPLLSRTMTMGEAAMRAKSATQDLDVRRSWVFFGDPATRLH